MGSIFGLEQPWFRRSGRAENKLRRQFLRKFLYCPEIIPAVGHKEEAACGARICFISPLTPPHTQIRLAEMRRRTLMRTTRLSRYPTQWQPWWGGRLRSCLYFGAELQPEGWLEPHGSQISKSIAPPRPPGPPRREVQQSAEKCNTCGWWGYSAPAEGICNAH